MTKKRVLAIPSDKWACGNYRIIEPYTLLSKLDRDIQFDIFNTKDNESINAQDFINILVKYDAVVFQRVANPTIGAIMMTLKKCGVKVYMDTDDDMYHISQTSPAYKYWKNGTESLLTYTKCLSIANAIFTSTPELASTLKERAPRVEVFRNGIDVSSAKYLPENSRRKEMPQDKTVVMWTGSSTHYDSLLVIARELRQLFEENPNLVFALCSNKEFLTMFDIPFDQKIYIPHVEFDDYYAIPSMCDIALTPVVESKFNNCKSELKCLEHGIWGIPCVSSPVAPYIRFNEVSGANLIAKKNRRQSWVNQIKTLAENASKRQELGQLAKQKVIEYYDVNKINEERYSFFERELL